VFDEGLPTTLREIFHDVVDRYSELLITGVRVDCVVDDVDPDCSLLLKSSRPTVHIALQTTSDGVVPLPNRRKHLAFM